MHSITVIVLHTFAAQAHAKDSVDKSVNKMANPAFHQVHDTKEELVDNLVDSLLDRALKVSSVHHVFSRLLSDLDSTTLDKPAPVVMSRSPSTFSFSRSPSSLSLGDHWSQLSREAASSHDMQLPIGRHPWAGNRPQTHREASTLINSETSTAASEVRSTVDSTEASHQVAQAGGMEDQQQKSEYSLIASGAVVPREQPYCEDAWFARIDERGGGVISVADGVGGYNDDGVDPGLYARVLAYEAAQAHDSSISLQTMISQAQNQTKLPGAATLCVVEIDGTKLRAANVGDSGFRVIRDGKIIFASPQQQHFFNCPLQLAYPPLFEDTDTGNDADVFNFPVEPDDLVIVASDGLYDNVFEDEIARVATEAAKLGRTKSALTATGAAADALVSLARKYAENEEYDSPFWEEWKRAEPKQALSGGKMDDITVVVGMVVPTVADTADLKEAVNNSDELAKSMKEEREAARGEESKTEQDIQLEKERKEKLAEKRKNNPLKKLFR